jgi:hypothetical protein
MSRMRPWPSARSYPVTKAPPSPTQAHQIAAEVIRYHKLSRPPVWIEHYPKETTDGHSETFELIVFSSYEVKEWAPYLGETKLTIGEPTWKPLEREILEALVGQEV